jgi:iron complex outermembrane receptor protein
VNVLIFNYPEGQEMDRNQRRVPRRLSLLACAVGHITLGAGIAALGSQEVAAQALAAEQQRSYAIPAGPLDDALNSFGRAAGILLSYSPESTANLRSAGLQGSYTVQQGLDRLLAGSGYRATRQPNGAYLLSRVMEQATVTAAAAMLPGITVTAEADRETATGPVNGYVARRSATGTKTDTALLEVPQSVSVIGRAEIEARGALDLMDVVAQTPGVATAAYGPDNRGWEYIALRGFPGNSSSFRDGLPQTQFGVVYRMTEPWGLERVEIMRGPSSVLFGQGDVGGVINRVSKAPGADNKREIEVQYGSFNRKQVAADLGAAQGDLSYRLLGLALNSNDQDRYPDGRRIDRSRRYLAPSLRWQISADTSLTLLSEFLKDKSGEDPYYIFFPTAGGTRAIKYGDPSFTRFSQDQYSLGYQLDHTINAAWSLRQNARYTDIALERNALWGDALLDDGHTLSRSTRTWDDGLKQSSIDTMLEGRLRNGSVTQTLLFGLDWNHLEGKALRFRGTGPDLDLLNPVYGMLVPQPTTPTADFTQKVDQIGLYAQDQIRIGQRWIATMGGRHDHVKSTTDDRLSAGRSRQSDDAFSGRAGVSYLLGAGWAPYVSYATSFLPVSGADSDNNPFKPSKGKQLEAGIKYQPDGGSALFTAAVFDLRKTNVLTYDNLTGDARQIGKQRSRGLELEAKAELARGLSATASLTTMSLKVQDSADTSEVGKVPPAVPERTASVWLDYAVGGGFGIGAGLNYVGPRQNDEANTNTERAFTLLNAAARYDVGPWRFMLSAANGLNKKYNTICYHGECYQGRQRTLVASARYHW